MSSSSNTGGGVNRLADSSSPYLLLHRHNPVDWYPWGDEALELARREDKPIFLSVGYSTCYWCHVMERESFSDEGTAALMNGDFVNIKLDREERPDLDEIYMAATQILTGQGGWPNSVFLTPQLEPFFAGTYFPPVDRPGLPAFRTVLRSMSSAWKGRRAEVEEQAASVGRAIRHHLSDRPPPGDSLPSRGVVSQAVSSLEQGFDREWGGFGGAPKFPTPSNLLLLAEVAAGDATAASMLSATLDHMARGGLYDQIGGGFHRYATDREWKVPHFEKMLYDNAWLLELFAREWARCGDPQAARVVRETVAFLEREMMSPEGALWSALDAETDGREGAFYVWTRQELLAVLGEEDFGFLAPMLGFDQAPFFEDDSYVLHLPLRLEAQAERRRMELEELSTQIAPLRRKLRRVRDARRRPLTDDKVLTEWNGMAIAGLAIAGRLLGEPGFIERAETAASFVLRELRAEDGRLLHAWREGKAHQPALLADYVFLVRGLLALARATGDGAWSGQAAELTRVQRSLFSDGDGAFFVSQKSDDLLVRSRDVFDGAVPAANAMAVLNLLELADLEASGPWRSQAEAALRAFQPLVESVPQATRTLAVAMVRLPEGAPSEERADDELGAALEAGDGGPVSLRVAWRAPLADGSRAFQIQLEVASGWHVYAPTDGSDAPEWVSALEISGHGGRLGNLELPDGKPLLAAAQREPVDVYVGTVAISGRLEPQGSRPRLAIRFQACDERRCSAPETRTFDMPHPSG